MPSLIKVSLEEYNSLVSQYLKSSEGASSAAKTEKIKRRSSKYNFQCPTFCFPPAKKRKLAHNEHLVCIELHPGPLSDVKEAAKLIRQTQNVINSGKKKSKKKNRKNNNNNSNNNSKRDLISGPITDAYLHMLVDPLNSDSVPSGFMTWTPTVMNQPFLRGTFTLLSDGAILIVNPDASLSAGNFTANNVLKNFLTLCQTEGSGITSRYGYAAANRTSILANTTTNRTSACGIEVMIEHPSTSQSGIIAVTRLNGLNGPTALDTFVTDDYQNLPQSKIWGAHGGSAQVKLNWLPSDVSDFSFSPNTNFDNGEGIYNPLVLSFKSFPAGTRIFYQILSHLECQQGNLISGSDTIGSTNSVSFTPALVDEHPTPDAFYRKASPIVASASDAMTFASSTVNSVTSAIDTATSLYRDVQKTYNKVTSLPGFKKAEKLGGLVSKYLRI